MRHMGACKVMVNGKAVYVHDEWDGWRTRSTVPFVLREGANRILWKVNVGTYSYYSARLTDADGNLLTNVLYSLGGDSEKDIVLSAAEQTQPIRTRVPLGIDMQRMAGSYVLNVRGAEGAHEVRVLSLNGRHVMQRSGVGACSYSIPARDLASGLYVVTLQTGDRVIRKRLAAF